MEEIFEVYDPSGRKKDGGTKKTVRQNDAGSLVDIYSLKVYPGDKPARNPKDWCIMEIRGDQSLNDLHRAIEPAFGRAGDRPYGFLFVGETHDNELDIVCYGSFGQDDRRVDIEVFSAGDRFTYVLYPAPDLAHIVEVVDVRRERAGVYPRVVAKPSPVGDGLSDNVVPLAERKKPAKVYTFKVYLGQKLKKRPRLPWRLIAIRGDQTLGTLHEAIYDAFDRWDEHLYSFHIGGVEFSVPEEEPDLLGPVRSFLGAAPGQDATKTVLDELGLSVGDWFTYLFDYGDEWWHVVELVGVEEGKGDGYPVVVEKRGESPPQYPEMEEDWDE